MTVVIIALAVVLLIGVLVAIGACRSARATDDAEDRMHKLVAQEGRDARVHARRLDGLARSLEESAAELAPTIRRRA